MAFKGELDLAQGFGWTSIKVSLYTWSIWY